MKFRERRKKDMGKRNFRIREISFIPQIILDQCRCHENKATNQFDESITIYDNDEEQSLPSPPMVMAPLFNSKYNEEAASNFEWRSIYKKHTQAFNSELYMRIK